MHSSALLSSCGSRSVLLHKATSQRRVRAQRGAMAIFSKSNGVDHGVQARPNESRNTEELTTNAGAPVTDDQNSLSMGKRGPLLLEDFQLLEKLGQFDREMIPARVVHARGAVGKGYFEVTHDITHLSKAEVFKSVGYKTPVTARLSTVTHPAGSPESLRDVRGFSVKFYTQEGNWDFVGNNIPVFFIRDGIQFPDLVHCLKPNPKTGIQEGWRILDFLSHHPESTHILTWLMDENGIPQDWRHMEGYGVNTYSLINAEGKQTLVKFHWRPTEGAKFLTDDEATQVGKNNMRHSHATHDLYNAIEEGNFPEWTFYIQTLDPAKQNDLYFDPLDATKVWPEEDFPLQQVGKMVLDKNVDNFFNENEQIAFSPGVTVPGIGYSNDKLLQTRLFSYSDTQRYRLGVNYQTLPINAPKCPFHNNANDGSMAMTQKHSEVNYAPSNIDPVKEQPEQKINTTAYTEGQTDTPVEEGIDKTENFRQARERYLMMTPERQDTFRMHFVSYMTDKKCTDAIRAKWIEHWTNVLPELGAAIEKETKEGLSGASGGPKKVHAATMA